MRWAREGTAECSEIMTRSVTSLLIATTHAMAVGMDVVHAATTHRCLASSGARAAIGTTTGGTGVVTGIEIPIVGNDAEHAAIASLIVIEAAGDEGRRTFGTAAFCPTSSIVCQRR